MTEEQASALHRAVKTMRVHQKAWFGGDKSRDRLQWSKQAERDVDRILSEIESKQGSLL